MLKYWLLFVTVASVGCQNSPFSPASPSLINDSITSNDSALARNILVNWSPYIHIHATAEATETYRDSISILKQRGNLRGARVEITVGGEGLNNPVISMIGSLGIEMLGLIENAYLFDENVEQRIDQIFKAYPEIHYFQIGNEITTILPKSGPTMTIEQYMTIFKRIYNHVQKNHPGRAMLLTQSTLGSGDHGARELEKMTLLGLTEMSPDKIIIGLNCYTPTAANQYTGTINGLLSQYRVWITETGVNDPSQHISFTLNGYPQLKNYLRPERIYWYAMWAGDSGSDTGFGLIRNPRNYPNYWKSDLLKILTDNQEGVK